MQDALGTWTIRASGIAVSSGTPKTLLQYAASSTNIAEVLAFSVTQTASSTSAMDQVQLIYKTAAATVTAGATGTTSAATVIDWTNGSGTFRGTLSTTGTGVNASAEGTDGTMPWGTGANVLGGYEFNAQPNLRLWVPASGIIALKMKGVNAGTWDAFLVICESK